MRITHAARHRCDTQSKLTVLSHYSCSDILSFRTNGAKLSIYRNSRTGSMSHSTPIGQIQFEEADPHTPVNSQRRLVTPPPVSSKVQRSGLVHIIGKDPPKIPNLFGDDFATIVPDDSQEQ